MKFGSSFTDTFKNKCTKFYQDIFRFGISIAHCLEVYFFPGHSVYIVIYYKKHMHIHAYLAV